MKGFRTPKNIIKNCYGGRVPLIVEKACKDFIVQNKLEFGKYRILLPLAIKSYKALPLSERSTWTLEDVVWQGL